jgi:hypothetical protein
MFDQIVLTYVVPMLQEIATDMLDGRLQLTCWTGITHFLLYRLFHPFYIQFTLGVTCPVIKKQLLPFLKTIYRNPV